MDGFTLMHEHVSLDLSGIKGDLDCRLDCKQQTIDEFKALFNYGVRNIVEVTNIGIGRDIDYIEAVARESRINIILSTGFYKEPFLPDCVKTQSIEALAQVMINELTIGIDGRNKCAGVIGEIGTSKDQMTPLEEKVFRAASLAHLETGALITTHTTLGSHGLAQIQLFQSMGVDLSKVVIGHVDLSGDYHYILAMIDAGVTVEFDTIGKINYLKDEIRIEILEKLISAGYQNQIVLSMDITRQSNMRHLGGIGYCYLFEQFLPALSAKGVDDRAITAMLQENPNRLLADILPRNRVVRSNQGESL